MTLDLLDHDGNTTHGANNGGMPDMAFLVASSLDDPEVFAPKMVVYAEQAPTWDLVDPGLTAFERMPAAEHMP